jgi:hypothetical protein
MLFQPTNIIPSGMSGPGFGVVYIDDTINLSWQVNGNTPMTGVGFAVYRIFETGTTELIAIRAKDPFDSPFYGTDEKGNIVRYVFAPNATWGNIGYFKFEVGNTYYIYIRQYYGDGDDYIATNTPIVVKCLIRPYLNVTLMDPDGTASVSGIANSPKILVEGRFQRRTDFDPSNISSVRWQTYLNDELLDDTGVLNTSVLKYEFDGALSGKTYIIKCTAETIYGETVIGDTHIPVSYPESLDDEAIQFYFDPTDSSSLIAISMGMIGRTPYLYRIEDKKLKFISEVSLGSSFYRDYGVKSGSPVQYEVIYYDPSTGNCDTRTSAVSCFQFRGYYLIEASQDENDSHIYHALRTWRFSNNLSVGSVTSNNTPSWLTNFTPYRLRQPSTRAGKSGTLQALLGNVNTENYTYQDTVDMQEELYAASLSNNTFFLKDMKGNLYMVGISGPITQTINIQSKVQQVTISVPWEEVGDASQISLIQTPFDEGWKENEVSEVVLSVDAETGILSATYPFPYYGTTFSLRNGELIASTKDFVPQPNLSLSNGSVLLET